MIHLGTLAAAGVCAALYVGTRKRWSESRGLFWFLIAHLGLFLLFGFLDEVLEEYEWRLRTQAFADGALVWEPPRGLLSVMKTRAAFLQGLVFSASPVCAVAMKRGVPWALVPFLIWAVLAVLLIMAMRGTIGVPTGVLG